LLIYNNISRGTLIAAFTFFRRKNMADNTTNHSDETAGARSNSIEDTPKTIGRATLVMVGAAILFVIIAIVLFVSFFNSPTGKTQLNFSDTEFRTARLVTEKFG
jgi:hypothetical protein